MTLRTAEKDGNIMEIPGYRDTWIEVDLQAIAANVISFRKHLSPQTEIMAVVKADGYGHGAVPVAKKALASGAAYLGVAFLGEACHLRQAGIEAPILVLGYTSPAYMEQAVKHGIDLTVFHLSALDALEEAAKRLGIKASIHIKVDTGMGRIGLKESDDELWQMFKRAAGSSHLEWKGIFTHYATADEEDHSLVDKQMERFSDLVDQLRRNNLAPPLIHASNSAGAAVFPNNSFSMIRLGISLYGLHPSQHVKTRGIPLQEAFSLKTRVSHVKTLAAGETVSYGATYKTKKPEIIATLPIGYADGYPRSLSNRGEVLVHGRRARIVGRVCMDQMMINVTDIPQTSIGDEVVVIGKQGDEWISVDEAAGWLNTINYEVTCMFSKRIPRLYVNA